MHPPPQSCLVRDLDREPLSPAAAVTLSRARVFLFGIAIPARQAAALLAGYTPDTHRDGVFRTSILSGERSFGEWRQLRALRPPRDPDLPELVASLEAFAERWRALSLAAAQRVEDAEDRAEIQACLEAGREYPSVTWRAKATVQLMRHLKKIPMASYQVVWNELAVQGFEDEVGSFDETLKTVQDWIERAPVDKAEVADMHRAREDAAGPVRDWLAARSAELDGFDELDRTVLGLGALEPPAGFEPPIALLADFRSPLKA
jgi:hypothetical protein